MKKQEFKKLTQKELSELYNNFVSYRDGVCKGHAKMGINEFYKKFGLSEYKE